MAMLVQYAEKGLDNGNTSERTNEGHAVSEEVEFAIDQAQGEVVTHPVLLMS